MKTTIALLALTNLIFTPQVREAAASQPAKAQRAHQKQGAAGENSAHREIYSAMEPEPGPGVKADPKSSLKKLDSFDGVPQAQREPISRRLKFVERLILEHGRAYDYRTTTLAELAAIHRHLEKTAGGSTKSGSTPTESTHNGEPEAPEPPKKRIHLPNLNQSRPEAPPEDTETEPSSDAGTATIPTHH